jgi:hypothetical protein
VVISLVDANDEISDCLPTDKFPLIVFTGSDSLGFYLFGKIKTALMEAKFKNEQKLVDDMVGIVNTISRAELEPIFEEWLSRLDKCIQRASEYLE